MRGRTNISGSGMNINANTENFMVADGNSIAGGDFVQYSMKKNDRKFDTNSSYGKYFCDSGNEAPKVLPCGNDNYVRRYSVSGNCRFDLVNVRNGFKVLSSFSVTSDNIPGFCLLDDANVAICYMKDEYTFSIRIYSAENRFALLNAFELEMERGDEAITDKGQSHIAQLGNSKIVVLRRNDCFVCEYSLGSIISNEYIELNLVYDQEYPVRYKAEQTEDNDWNLYAIEEDKFMVFSKFKYVGKSYYKIFLLKIAENQVQILDEIENYSDADGDGLNGALWGNAFGMGGKVLFSLGGPNDDRYDVNTNVLDYYKTKIYYVENDYIMNSSEVNLLEYSMEAFGDLNIELITWPGYLSSGTAQYVKENVFYVAIMPHKGSENPKSRTAIYRVEYNPDSGMFSRSDIVTFEGDSNNYKFGYGQFFESENGDVYYLYETQSSASYAKSGRYLLKLTYKNGVLEIGENTGMVESYKEGGASIGVAKQSGKAGDVIEVYTPKA